MKLKSFMLYLVGFLIVIQPIQIVVAVLMRPTLIK